MKAPKTANLKLNSLFNEHTVALTLKFSILTFSVIALYLQDLSMIFGGALSDEASFHILAIPFLFGYLLFRKRRMIAAALEPIQVGMRGFKKYFNVLAGASLCAVAILTYWYGSYSFTPLEYHMLTLPFLTAGLVLIFFGTKMLKQLLFPIAFLFFLTPPPAEVLYGVGSALANLSAIASNGLANLFGIRAVLSTSNGIPLITLFKPDGASLPFSVDVACSGIYSIIGFVIFALFIAYIMTGSRLRQKLAIIGLGIPLIVFLNIIRITTILVIGYNFGQELALQVFHAVGATVLMFIGTLILLAVTEKLFKKPPPTQPCIACSSTTTPIEQLCTSCGKLFHYPKIRLNRADVAKIAGILTVVVVLLSIQAPVFALTQGPAEVIIQTPTGPQVNTANPLLPNITGYKLSFVFRDTAFEKASSQDAAIAYAYAPTSNDSRQVAWVTVEIADSTTKLHRWETCLINFPLSQGQEVAVNQLDLRDVQLQDNPPMTARYFSFDYKNRNQTQTVLYWYQTATFSANGTTQTKHVKISVVLYPSGPDRISQAEDQALPIAVAINDHWQPIKTWSAVALAISQNGIVLSSVAAIIFVLIILYSIYIDSREKASLLTLYKKLPNQDQLLIQAIESIQNSQNITTQAILSELQKLSTVPIPESFVMQKLEEAERAGLIKKVLTNKADNPALFWRVQLPKQTSFLSRLRSFKTVF